MTKTKTTKDLEIDSDLHELSVIADRLPKLLEEIEKQQMAEIIEIIKIEEDFFNKLANKLEEIFPKTNQDHPEIPSEGNRSGALVLLAFANIYLREALTAQKIQTRQAPKEENK